MGAVSKHRLLDRVQRETLGYFTEIGRAHV
jgi:hypothetical protein